MAISTIDPSSSLFATAVYPFTETVRWVPTECQALQMHRPVERCPYGAHSSSRGRRTWKQKESILFRVLLWYKEVISTQGDEEWGQESHHRRSDLKLSLKKQDTEA